MTLKDRVVVDKLHEFTHGSPKLWWEESFEMG